MASFSSQEAATEPWWGPKEDMTMPDSWVSPGRVDDKDNISALDPVRSDKHSSSSHVLFQNCVERKVGRGVGFEFHSFVQTWSAERDRELDLKRGCFTDV